MSHFKIGVICNDIDDIPNLLAPYDQNDEHFFQDIPYLTKEEYIQNFRNFYDNCKPLSDEEIWRQALRDYDGQIINNCIYERYNPNAQWDWYTIGGRWPNSLKVLKGTKGLSSNFLDMDYMNQPRKETGKYRWVDCAQIKDILWKQMNTPTPEERTKYSQFWNEYVEGNNPNNNSHKWEDYTFYKPDYLKKTYQNKTNFIKQASLFKIHALIDGDTGEWIDNMDEGNKLIDSYITNPNYQNKILAIVDCHY